ncbi:MAG: hypothetical protein WAM94_10215 [Chromatiaceae bacterium]
MQQQKLIQGSTNGIRALWCWRWTAAHRKMVCEKIADRLRSDFPLIRRPFRQPAHEVDRRSQVGMHRSVSMSSRIEMGGQFPKEAAVTVCGWQNLYQITTDGSFGHEYPS